MWHVQGCPGLLSCFVMSGSLSCKCTDISGPVPTCIDVHYGKQEESCLPEQVARWWVLPRWCLCCEVTWRAYEGLGLCQGHVPQRLDA